MIRLITFALTLVLPAQALTGQFAAPVASDSLEFLEEARDVQARYERYREQRTPPDLADVTARCDEIVTLSPSRVASMVLS